MKKTQQVVKSLSKTENKASFKNILNIENQKIPQKRQQTRSRSIRDRQHTQTFQSRTIQNTQQSQYQNNSRDYRSNTTQINSTKNINSSQNKKQNISMKKIMDNMRNQSIEHERKRSKSIRRRSKNNKDHSLSKQQIKTKVNKFNNNLIENEQRYQQNNNEQQVQQDVERGNNIIVEIKQIKNKLKIIENDYNSYKKVQSIISNQFDYKNSSKNDEGYERNLLRQRVDDLNNIIDSFHIECKQNLINLNKEVSGKLDKLNNNGFEEKIQNKFVKLKQQEDLFEKMKIKLQNQYSLGNLVKNNRVDEGLLYEFERRVKLTEKRLIKQ